MDLTSVISHLNLSLCRMGRKFFISDLHLGDTHYLKKIHEKYGIQFTPKEHCNLLINNCNNVLEKDDKLYIIGDVTIGKISKEMFRFFYKVKYKKYLVLGNHDSWKVTEMLLRHKLVQEIYGSIELDGYLITHIPTIMSEIVCQEKQYYKGNIHGHIHDIDKQNELDNKIYFNVCSNLNKFTPISFEKIKEEFMRDD